jgi:glycosyltransferase involved in cell wall biosynthesis
MDNPLISIVMSVRNGADTIKETIESVIAQTYKNWELIIGDNCSTDNTISIIESFNDPRIRLIQNEFDYGLLYNQLLLRREIKGEFCKGVDDDSYLYPQNLEKELSVLLENKNIAFVTCDTEYITPNGKKISARVPFEKDIITKDEYIRYTLMTARGSIQEGNQTLHRTSLNRNADITMMSKGLPAGLINLYTPYFYIPSLILSHGDLYIIHETLSSNRMQQDSYSLKFNQAKLQVSWIKLLRNDGYKINPLLCIWAHIIIMLRATARKIVFRIFGK